MIELWNTMDGASKIVVISSLLVIVFGVMGFVWFMMSKSRQK